MCQYYKKKIKKKSVWEKKITEIKQNSCGHTLGFYNNLKYSNHTGTSQQNYHAFHLCVSTL